MTFRFFGDSWFWTWMREDFFKSKTFIMDTGTGLNRFSTMKHLFKSFGHDVVNYCHPGQGPFYSMTPIIQNRFITQEAKEIWIWFMSNVQRDTPRFENSEPRPRSNFVFDQGLDSYIESYDNLVINAISQANANLKKCENVTLILIGGHTSLPKSVFDKVPNLSPNVMLMTENIMGDLLEEYDGHTSNQIRNLLERYSTKYNPELIRRFLFCDGDYFTHQSSDNVDRSIEDFFLTIVDARNEYNQIISRSPGIPMYWPDRFHIGLAGQICLTDQILKFCEDNNLI